MNETEECPPWKRRKVTHRSDEGNGMVSHQESESRIWIPDRLNHVIAELSPDARETLALCRTVMGILNRLTWENFEKLSENMKRLRIDTPTKIQLVVDMIHKRAIVEGNYRILYVKMCNVLRKAQVSDDRKTILSFSTCLIAKCEEFFTQSLRQDDYFYERKKAIDSCVDKILRKSAKEAYEFEENVFRKNLVGNCEFVGDLYNMKIIHSGIIFDMLNRLLKATLFVSVQCICILISTVGFFYEEKNGKFPEKYFDKLISVMESEGVPVWIRYHIKELLELRYRNWRSRKMMDLAKPTAIRPKKRDQEFNKNQETSSKTDSFKPIAIPSKKRVQEFNKTQETISKTNSSEPTAIPPKKHVQEFNKIQETISETELIQESKIDQDEVQFIEIIQKPEINQDQVQPQSSFKDRVCKALDALTFNNIEIQITNLVPLVHMFELEYLADVIFRKAICRPNKCKMYTKLCNALESFCVPIGDDKSCDIEFKTVVLKKCQKLFNKLGTRKLEKDKTQIRREVLNSYQFIIELSKAKILTPEFNFNLCSRLIELGIEDLVEFVWLRDLLKINGKEILLKLKEQERYEELFQFIDKLHHISKNEKKCKSTTYVSYIKSELKRFIYGVENECCVIQDIVHLGPIPSMKELTSTTLFWYLRVFFNECRLEAKIAPEWVSLQKNIFSSNKASPEAISQFLKYAILGNDFIAARTGRFFIYLIKWNLISPQDVINGISILLPSIVQQKNKRNLPKIITSLLSENGYFELKDFKKVLPKNLLPKLDIKIEKIEPDVAPIPPIANNPEKLIQDLIQLQLSFEDRVQKAIDELTPSNIENQIFLMIPLVKEHQFVYVVDSIFQNAICKPNKSELYAKLCYDMWSFRAPNGDDELDHVEFKTIVLRKCLQLLDEFETKKWEAQIQFSVEEKNEIHRKATGNFRLIVELSKLKVFTTEFIFILISKLIDLRNEELFEWLSELLPANWKTILLKLKEQGRYDEIFQFFDKLENLLKDENYNSTSDTQWKSAFRKFIYGIENECFIQEIVYEGAISLLKEFTPTTLFWYFKVCFNHCHLKAKKPPEWVSSQKKRLSSSKALPEAILQFNMSINILDDDFIAHRTGQFYIYLIKWYIISPLDVIDGLSSILVPSIQEREKLKRWKIISRYLLVSGYFEFNDLKKLFKDLIPNPRKPIVPDTQIPTTSSKTSDAQSSLRNGRGNFIEDAPIIPQLAETLEKRQMLKKLFLDASKYVPPSMYCFNPLEFKSQVENVLFDVEDMKTAALCLVEVMMEYPDLCEFYVTEICPSIFKLTIEENQFWMVLLNVCDTYYDQLLFSTNNTSDDESSMDEEESSMADELISESASMAVIVPNSAENQHRRTIFVPIEEFNKINEMNINRTESFCSLCTLTTTAGDIQLEKINKAVEFYRVIMAHLRKRVSVQSIQQIHSFAVGRNICTIYMPREQYYKFLKSKISKTIVPLCFSCGFRNEALDNLKLKLECIEKVLDYINFQVDFKLDDRKRSEATAKKRISIRKKALCRFFSKLVNILNNKTADIVIKRLMRRLLNAHRIDFFCEIYFNLDRKKDRFEKSLFVVKIPEVLSNDDLDYEHREMLDDVLNDYLRGARKEQALGKKTIWKPVRIENA